MLEKTTRKKGIQIRGGRAERAERENGVKNAKMGENGIQIAMIRILAMRSSVEGVGNLRQHVN